MILRLENVSKVVYVRGKPHTLLDGLDLEVERGQRVGVLALPKSGKTTLLRIACGIGNLDGGRVERDGNISWLIPTTDFFNAGSSAVWNIRSIARLYGVSDSDFPKRVAEIARVSQILNEPISTFLPAQRQQLGFALGILMDFDLYLFDQLIVPNGNDYKETGAKYLAQYMDGKSLLLATSLPEPVATYCDSAYVLENGRATHYSDVKEAAAYFKGLLKADAERKKAAEKKGEDDDDRGQGEADQSVELLQVAVSDI